MDNKNNLHLSGCTFSIIEAIMRNYVDGEPANHGYTGAIPLSVEVSQCSDEGYIALVGERVSLVPIHKDSNPIIMMNVIEDELNRVGEPHADAIVGFVEKITMNKEWINTICIHSGLLADKNAVLAAVAEYRNKVNAKVNVFYFEKTENNRIIESCSYRTSIIDSNVQMSQQLMVSVIKSWNKIDNNNDYCLE